MTHQRNKGVTLIELVVVICIVAILLTLILPSYLQQIRDTRRSLGSAALLEVMMRQEQFFLDHKRYADTLTDLAYPTHPFAIDAQGRVMPELSADRIYLIELTTRTYAYTIVATPQLDQALDHACGTLSLDSRGAKLATGEGDQQRCW
jgi:type IV pilus assembly protein PilE